MFHDLIGANTDAMFYIFQCIDIVELGRLCSVNKTFNRMLCDTARGRQLWLKLGIDATCGVNGFEAEDVRRIFDHLHEKREYFWNLRLLVCPWHAADVALPLQSGRRGYHDQAANLFISQDESRLFLSVREGTGQMSFPSRPNCSGFAENTVWDDDSVISSSVIGYSACKYDDLIMKKAMRHEIVPDLSHDRGSVHTLIQVHEGVFAVIEKIMNDTFGFDHVVDDGIYFMSSKTGRMLRHIKCGFLDNREMGAIMISRPTEMWILTFDGIKYFGNSCAPRSDENIFAEKMDPSLWMIAKGDSKGAIEHMHRIGAPLDTASLISNRTLLHYAAMEGHSNAVSVLIKAAGGIDVLDVNALDEWSHSALFLAAAELHLDVVKVLLDEGDADVLEGISEGETVLCGIGAHVLFRPYNLDTTRIKDEINSLIPSIIECLIQKNKEVVYSYSDIFDDAFIISSPDAVRMLLAAGSDCFQGCNHAAKIFGCFRSRAHEISAISSFYVMVREFGHDINFVDSVVEERAVISLAKHGIAESVIVLIEHLDADPASKDKGGRSIREIAEARAQAPADVDGKRILSFLDSRGL